MDNAELVLTALVIVCGVGTAAAQALERRTVVYVLKPLTTFLILMLSIMVPAPVSRFYQTAVAVRLGFSIVGDVFLMFRRIPRWIMLGGVFFLCAHLVYLPALGRVAGLQVSPAVVIPFVLYAVVWVVVLLPRLTPQLRLPIAIYTVVLVSTGWLAAEQVLQSADPRVVTIFAAMLLFILSDSVLGYNRFVKQGIRLEPLVLVLYFAAQLLTALTV